MYVCNIILYIYIIMVYILFETDLFLKIGKVFRYWYTNGGTQKQPGRVACSAPFHLRHWVPFMQQMEIKRKLNRPFIRHVPRTLEAGSWHVLSGWTWELLVFYCLAGLEDFRDGPPPERGLYPWYQCHAAEHDDCLMAVTCLRQTLYIVHQSAATSVRYDGQRMTKGRWL